MCHIVAAKNAWVQKYKGYYLVSISEVSNHGPSHDPVSLGLWQGWTWLECVIEISTLREARVFRERKGPSTKCIVPNDILITYFLQLVLTSQ